MEHTLMVSMLPEVLYSLQQNPDTPWYLIELVRVALNLSTEVNDLRVLCMVQSEKLTDLNKVLDQLQTKYSEVLYHLKTVSK